jgi:hypothetical protein
MTSAVLPVTSPSKAELKALMPEDAKEAIGHGIHARRSKSGAVTIDLLQSEGGHASSSESIGAIAAALGKAQLEIINPEKSLVGVIPPSGPRELGRAYPPNLSLTEPK